MAVANISLYARRIAAVMGNMGAEKGGADGTAAPKGYLDGKYTHYILTLTLTLLVIHHIVAVVLSWSLL